MKKIGFIDYYISEWHANNYPEWIGEACQKKGFDFEVKYAYAEEYISPYDGRNTDEWCAAFGVERCYSIAELCEKSDFIIILAPSNPEKHLGYAAEALKYGKRTYIDKTFAPDYKTANEIFDLGKKYGAPFFSSSALRYSAALDGIENPKYVTTFGGGSNFDEYAVHQAEMVISVLKEKPLSVRVEKQGAQYCTFVKLSGDREATMLYSPTLPYAISFENVNGKTEHRPAGAGHFQNLMLDIVEFFDTGRVSFDTNETLEVMKLREAAVKGCGRIGEYIQI
jgi:hypothetical protein